MYSCHQGSGRFQVDLTVIDTTNGLVCVIIGGESPHLGGVALAVPRQSMSGIGVSADIWLSPVPGHKDIYVAQEIAQLLSISLNVNVSLSVGIHIDNATAREIRIINENCLEAAKNFLKQYSI